VRIERWGRGLRKVGCFREFVINLVRRLVQAFLVTGKAISTYSLRRPQANEKGRGKLRAEKTKSISIVRGYGLLRREGHINLRGGFKGDLKGRKGGRLTEKSGTIRESWQNENWSKRKREVRSKPISGEKTLSRWISDRDFWVGPKKIQKKNPRGGGGEKGS